MQPGTIISFGINKVLSYLILSYVIIKAKDFGWSCICHACQINVCSAFLFIFVTFGTSIILMRSEHCDNL